MAKLPKYFVGTDQGEFNVMYEDFCEIGGNTYSTEKSGLSSQSDAQKYADSLNATDSKANA